MSVLPLAGLNRREPGRERHLHGPKLDKNRRGQQTRKVFHWSRCQAYPRRFCWGM